MLVSSALVKKYVLSRELTCPPREKGKSSSKATALMGYVIVEGKCFIKIGEGASRKVGQMEMKCLKRHPAL